jgi:two-component system chemotaxis response regulator CheY
MSATETKPKETIVIAEDSPPNRKILAHLLGKLGFIVVACENGQAAWDELSSGRHQTVVAVISDIMMPNMDGIQLLRNVRGNETLKHLPFVLVTAVSEREYIVQAKELNVNGYILKPVTFQRVTGKLQELFPTKTFPKLAG